MTLTRKTFQRLGLGLLAVLMLAAIFHRPLLFRVTRYFIARAAEQQDLKLAYQMDGTIFTGLRITDLKATPTEPGPVEQIEIASLRLEYSLWGLWRKGLPGFLQSAAVRDARVVIDPAKSLPPEKAQKDQSIKFPALIPEKLTIENLDFTVRQPGADLVIADFNLLLDPQRAGFVRAGLVQIPGFESWKDFAAEASYARRDLVLKNFALGPPVQVARLNLDMSKLS